MDTNIREIAARIRSLREMLEISPADMAEKLGISQAEYLSCESGDNDLSFTFVHKCAEQLNVDIVELMTGDAPKLKYYTVTRSGEGLPLKRRQGFNYDHLSFRFRDKYSEPFLVTAPYKAGNETAEIALSTHEGQEFDFVINGKLRCLIGDGEEILSAGDSIYYDSGKPHGMVAVGGTNCEFLAIVMKKR